MSLILPTARPNTVFVYGSNKAGIHGKGAALYAKQHYGAENYKNFRWRMSYGIPTKDTDIKTTLPLSEINEYVQDFKLHAANNLDTWFLLTKIGCGLAGLSVIDVAPMFKGVTRNVIIPYDFSRYV